MLVYHRLDMPTETLFQSVLVFHEGERHRIVHRSQIKDGAYSDHARLMPLVAQTRLDDWLRGPAGDDIRRLGAQLSGWAYSSRPLDADRQLRDVLERELDDFNGSLVVLIEPPTHFQPLASEEVDELEHVGTSEENHWIEILLVDGTGQPVRNAPYSITTPNRKKQQTGYTNKFGAIYISNIDSGTCEFCFTDIDKDAWEPAEG